MKCFYINLADAAARRQSIEANFASRDKAGFSLTRFPAFDRQWVADHKIEGKATAAEKACFMSHRTVIEDNRDAAEPFCVFEDDTFFGAHSFANIQKLMQEPRAPDWDLIFLDAIIVRSPQLARLTEATREARQNQSFMVFNMRGLAFAGASAYVVNPARIDRILDVLDRAAMNDAIDTVICAASFHGHLNCLLTFPFLTTLSELSVHSSIQPHHASAKDFIFNTFRIMTWMEQTEDESLKRFRLLHAVLAGTAQGTAP